MKGYPSPRPLTHDLIVNVVENLGGEFQDVVISELKDHTYYARRPVRHDGELIEIDARPSDAIAVAVTCNPVLPIYVNEDVLNDVLGGQYLKGNGGGCRQSVPDLNNMLPTTCSVPFLAVGQQTFLSAVCVACPWQTKMSAPPSQEPPCSTSSSSPPIPTTPNWAWAGPF